MLPTRTQPLDRIASLPFKRRKESWVAEDDGCFYKIPRRGDDPVRDLDDPACIDTALREYTDMRFLAKLAAGDMCRPERIERACVVYPRLSGPDLRERLLHGHPHGDHEASLRGAMRLLARLHHADAMDYPARDYTRDGFLAPTPALLDRMQARPRTLVVTGFEARNFRFDQASDAWVFFDPHHLWRGFPEEDFARFMVSLLMLRGRRGTLQPWTGFDRFRLLAAYEDSAPARLDRRLLDFFLDERLAMRRFHAMRSVHRMPAASRPLGAAYTWLYYQRLQHARASLSFQRRLDN
ncbi:MAG: hypothetical protein EPN36_00095 [Rhodanobacteraceae bacterium]|nr:MAG: hypothetical protein EPN36_00095 [Rhodanobacteraceae bacterium]